MSSRTSRKSKNPRAKAPEPIITRNKSAQQRRQLRNKEEKKTEKPDFTKPETKFPRPETKLSKPEIKSPRPEIKSSRPETKSSKPETKTPKPEIKSTKPNQTVKPSQVSLLKPVKVPEEVLEQIEYYPNTLKREFRAKKIMLKPKHNFKVIAATNKRKMATPQKGIKSPSSKNSPLSPKGSRFSTRPCSSPELSMQDMVRMMEETRSLSDEDFMEILTCPSPVWWEDPPDGGIDEGTIHKRKSEPPSKKITKETKKRKIPTKTTTKRIKKHIVIDLVEEIELPKEKPKDSDERFVKKKQKLENILGNLKNKAIKPKKNADNTTRKISESDFSDLSFNEEEILKNLENIDIPIEESLTESTDESLDDTVAPKNYNANRATLSTCVPVIKEVFSIKSTVFDSSDFKSDVSSEEINFQSDTKSDEIVFLDRCTNSSLSNNDDSCSIIDLVDTNSNSNRGRNSPIENNSNLDHIKNSDAIKNEDVPTKKAKVLSEYINVYKITPETQKSENNPDIDSKPVENTAITKLEAVRGKLNDFFKQCKSNKRLKKTENAVPANPVIDVMEAPIDNKKENGDSIIDADDEKNRLKSCDYCVQKTENGTKDFSCEKCEMAPILPCGLCNFLADTKEVYKKHVSSCKDVARINWSHNYVLNQT